MSRTSVKSRFESRLPTLQQRTNLSGFGFGNLAGEGSRCQSVTQTRPQVVEGASVKDADFVGAEILVAEHLLGDLAHGVWVAGPEGGRLLDGQILWFDKTVGVAAPGVEQAHPLGQSGLTNGLKQAEGDVDIRVESFDRGIDGSPRNSGPPGER